MLQRGFTFSLLVVCLIGMQVAVSTHLFDPCDLLEEAKAGEACAEACHQCAPQANGSQGPPPAATSVSPWAATDVQVAATPAGPSFGPTLSYRSRAPPPVL